MSIFRAKTDLLGRRQCKRCRRMFHPRTEGQEYGSTCARKIMRDPIVTACEDIERERESVLDRFGAD